MLWTRAGAWTRPRDRARARAGARASRADVILLLLATVLTACCVPVHTSSLRTRTREKTPGVGSVVTIIPSHVEDAICELPVCNEATSTLAQSFLSRFEKQISMVATPLIELLEAMVSRFIQMRLDAEQNQERLQEHILGTQVGTIKTTVLNTAKEAVIDNFVNQFSEVQEQLARTREQYEKSRSDFDNLRNTFGEFEEGLKESTQSSKQVLATLKQVSDQIAKYDRFTSKCGTMLEEAAADLTRTDQETCDACDERFQKDVLTRPCKKAVRSAQAVAKFEEQLTKKESSAGEFVKKIKAGIEKIEGLENEFKDKLAEYGDKNFQLQQTIKQKSADESQKLSIHAGSGETKVQSKSKSKVSKSSQQIAAMHEHAMGITGDSLSLLELEAGSGARARETASAVVRADPRQEEAGQRFFNQIRKAALLVHEVMTIPSTTNSLQQVTEAFDASAQIMDQLLETTLRGVACMEEYARYYDQQAAQTLEVTRSTTEDIRNSNHKLDRKLAEEKLAVEKTMVQIINENRKLLAMFEKLREADPTRVIADQVRKQLAPIPNTFQVCQTEFRNFLHDDTCTPCRKGAQTSSADDELSTKVKIEKYGSDLDQLVKQMASAVKQLNTDKERTDVTESKLQASMNTVALHTAKALEEDDE